MPSYEVFDRQTGLTIRAGLGVDPGVPPEGAAVRLVPDLPAKDPVVTKLEAIAADLAAIKAKLAI